MKENYFIYEELNKDLDLSIEEKKDKDGFIGTLKFAWIQANTRNKNGRIYPEKIVKREIEKFNKKQKGVLGQLMHPIGGHTNLINASHIITQLEYDEKTKAGWALAKILDTSKGRDVKELLKQSNRYEGLGASLRGFSKKGIGQDGVVPDDFELESVDVVYKQSFQNAGLSSANLFESVNNILTKEEEEKIYSRDLREKRLAKVE